MRNPAAAPETAAFGLSRAWEWYARLPRVSVVMITITVFLFAVNVFSGLQKSGFNGPPRLCC